MIDDHILQESFRFLSVKDLGHAERVHSSWRSAAEHAWSTHAEKLRLPPGKPHVADFYRALVVTNAAVKQQRHHYDVLFNGIYRLRSPGCFNCSLKFHFRPLRSVYRDHYRFFCRLGTFKEAIFVGWAQIELERSQNNDLCFVLNRDNGYSGSFDIDRTFELSRQLEFTLVATSQQSCELVYSVGGAEGHHISSALKFMVRHDEAHAKPTSRMYYGAYSRVNCHLKKLRDGIQCRLFLD